MAAQSQYLASLDEAGRKALEQRLLDRQSGRCFICNKLIDLVLHAGQLDIDHIIPRADIGPDEENNFAITHATCNRQKGASDLRRGTSHCRVRGASRGGYRTRRAGCKPRARPRPVQWREAELRLRRCEDAVEFALSKVGKNEIRHVPLYKDPLSDMEYFFTVLPLEYLHHDDRINPAQHRGQHSRAD